MRSLPLQRALRRCDPLLAGAALGLVVMGVLFIYSAGRQSPTLALLWRRQLGWAVAAMAAFVAVLSAGYRRILASATALYAIAVAVLVLTLLFGVKINGARCWLNLFGVQLQPSEFAKIATILLTARMLARPDLRADRWSSLLQVGAVAGLPFALIVLQPDLGTAAVLLPVTLAMLLVAGMRARQLAVLTALGLLTLPAAWFVLDEYQRERIRVFLDPWRDPLGSGWNKIQSELAIGSGGLWGKGWLAGTQNTLGYLPRPVAPTDFIFSVVAEETGFVGSSLLILLFAVLIVRGFAAAAEAPDREGMLLATGLTALVFTHAFINLAMTIGLLPITGLPLPLVSYGGSFLLAIGIALGLIQSVRAQRAIRE
ncbi:MAG: rod shape-determining protein RodA [Kiritimatiellae bacterium]|nr:rod shape-determining protein RodA [Kiritimatiellia bacterium]